MRLVDTIQIRQNLILTARERGKVVARRQGHNIWLDVGREYLAQLISFQSFGPDTPIRDDRIKYMGVGIGGTRQLALATANSVPISPPYTGTNIQTDTNPTLTVIERPVRISGSATAYPGISGDAWIGQIGAPPDLSGGTEVVFRRVLTASDVSYGPFLSVPLSEVMLFTSTADPGNHQNTGVAYDTFDTISKTAAIDLEIVWTIRF